MNDLAAASLTLTPIGTIRTPMNLKFDAPSQPDRSKHEERCIIELFPGRNFEAALEDLTGFSHIWLIWWFNKNTTWRPKVLPPRGSDVKRGVFATRSPHRPNPIGITAVPLYGISGLRLTIGANDLLDGTPILDIKPYISDHDSFAQMKNGWLDQAKAKLEGPALFKVSLSESAKVQNLWLNERGISFVERAVQLLERTPQPHRTRRIIKKKNGGFRMGCGAWRLHFSVEGSEVIVERFSPGYPKTILESPGYEQVPNRAEQIQFAEKWPAID